MSEIPGEHRPEVLLRLIEPRDATEVALLAEQLGYTRSAEEIQVWIQDLAPGLGSHADLQAAFVACLGDEVVGWVAVSIERHLQSEPHVLIGGLVVKEGIRGKGIGRRLCQHAEQWGRSRGVKKVRVTSRSTRPDAHRFYLQDGYEQVKTSLVFDKLL
jgi:GNAT superfamily N-acetyltransferase